MAGGVTPRQVYQALINAGASTIQAIGIMANALNESGLNPEAVNSQDPNGGSYGLVQENGTQYAGLVTGNPVKDLAAQVRVLAQNGGIRAASGSNSGEAAGNFAANYERCVGCQPGGAQYNQRVANAAVVAGWVASGKWPASAGSPSAGGGAVANATGSGTSTSSKDASCAWGFTLGGGKVAGIASLPSADICVLKKTTIRHIVGGGLLAAGFIIGLPGVVIILAFGFRASGAATQVTNVLGVVPTPGAQAASRAVASPRAAAAGRVRRRQAETRRAGQAAQRQQQAERRRTERAEAEVQRPRRLRPVRRRPPNYRPPAEIGEPGEFHHE